MSKFDDAGKAFDLAILALEYLLARNIRITELAHEMELARAEGRQTDVKRFKDAADAAQAGAHAHLDV